MDSQIAWVHRLEMAVVALKDVSLTVASPHVNFEVSTLYSLVITLPAFQKPALSVHTCHVISQFVTVLAFVSAVLTL